MKLSFFNCIKTIKVIVLNYLTVFIITSPFQHVRILIILITIHLQEIENNNLNDTYLRFNFIHDF